MEVRGCCVCVVGWGEYLVLGAVLGSLFIKVIVSF